MSQPIREQFGNGVLTGWVEISLPPPVPWSFEAPGWRLLLALLLLWVTWRGWHMWRRWMADAYRREGLAELDSLVASTPDWRQRACRLPVILKSVALHGFTRDQVAALSGQAWHDFLQSRARGAFFGEQEWHVLQAVDYQDKTEWGFDEIAVDRCESAIRAWIREHRGLQDD